MNIRKMTASVRVENGVIQSHDIHDAAQSGSGKVVFRFFPKDFLDDGGLIPDETPVKAGKMWMIISKSRRFYRSDGVFEGFLLANVRRAKASEKVVIEVMLS